MTRKLSNSSWRLGPRWRRVRSLGDLLIANEGSYFEFYPGTKQRCQPFYWSGNGDFTRFHKYTKQLGPMRFYFEPKCLVFANGIIADSRGLIVRGTDLHADEVFDLTHPANQRVNAFEWPGGKKSIQLAKRLKPKRVASPALVVAQCGFRTYGHWLLDIIPKLALLSLLPIDLSIVVPWELLPWQSELLMMLGITSDRVISYHPGKEFLEIEECYFTSHPRCYYAVHPIANIAFDALRNSAMQASSDNSTRTRLFVSRAMITDDSQRITNQDEVLNILKKRGFQIIHPETLSVAEQIRSFAAAELVVGEQGSALHGTGFSNKGTPVLCLHSETAQYFAQAGLGAIKGQPTGFIFGAYHGEDDHSGKQRVFEIDTKHLAAALDLMEARITQAPR